MWVNFYAKCWDGSIKPLSDFVDDIRMFCRSELARQVNRSALSNLTNTYLCLPFQMSKIIHHLNTNSFDLKELKRHPHILFLDSDKLANRLAELKMMGHASVTVKLLCSPELIYQSTLQKIKADLTSSKHEDESD